MKVKLCPLPKVSKSQFSTPFRLWTNLPPVPEEHQGEHVSRPFGCGTARIVMVGPVPDERERASGKAFSGITSVKFLSILVHTGILPTHFFAIPCCRYGKKALTHNTKDIRGLILEGIERELIDFVVTVGGDSTKWVVNGGKKVNMNHFQSKLVYPPGLSYKPLFVFPDISALNPEMTEDSRENYFRKRAAENLMRRIEKCAFQLKRAINPRNH